MKIKDKKRLILGIIILFTILFIWAHSFSKGNNSQNESDSLKEFFINIAAFFGLDIKESFFIEYIRKFGHFAEYGILGFELILFKILCLDKRFQTTANVFFVGVFTAFVDETIQLIPILERSSQVSDIWIDVAGVFCGMAITYLFYFVVIQRRKKLK